jgi:hypothetical protein
MKDPATRERFNGLAFESVGSSAKEHAALLKRETETWTRLVKANPIKRD